MRLNIDIDLYEMKSAMLEMSYDEIFEFITGLDEGMENWDFTMRLYKHFEALKKVYDEEPK